MNRSERIKIGIRDAQQRGVRVGRPPRLERFALGVAARRLRAQGETWRAIGLQLGLDKRTVQRYAALVSDAFLAEN